MFYSKNELGATGSVTRTGFRPHQYCEAVYKSSSLSSVKTFNRLSDREGRGEHSVPLQETVHRADIGRYRVSHYKRLTDTDKPSQSKI